MPGLVHKIHNYSRVLRAGTTMIAGAGMTLVRDHWLGCLLPPLPLSLQFPVTDICNSRCLMCNVWRQKRGQELTPDDMRRILANPLFRKIRYAGINGGEPTLRTDLAEIGRAMVESLPNLRGVAVITNAIRPAQVLPRIQALADVVRAAGREMSVSVSLDGIGELHDRNRGVSGNFAGAVQVIDAVRQAGIPVSAGCTLTPVNCGGADDVLAWCRERGLRCVFRTAVDIKRIYNDGYQAEHPFTPEQRFHVTMFFDKLAHDPETDPERRRFYRSLVGQLAFDAPRALGCAWQRRGVTLDAHGNISYCSVQSALLGSALEDDARTLFAAGMPERRRILGEQCATCRHDLLDAPPPGEMAREGVRLITEPFIKRLSRKRPPAPVRLPETVHAPERPRPADWRHVLITGWYGTETAGDKAILGELVHFIRKRAPDCRITLSTIDRKVSEQTFREMPELAGIEQAAIADAAHPARIGDIDAVVIGGGPLQEIREAELIYRMFAEANRRRKARVIFGCGVGPIHTDRMRDIISGIFRLATSGFLRDAESHEKAIALGGPSFLGCACDPALGYLRRWAREHAPAARPDGPPRLVGLFRANTDEYVAGEQAASLQEKNAQAARTLAAAVESFCAADGARADLLAMHALWVGGDDRLFNRQVAAAFHDPDRVHVERAYLPLPALLERLADGDLAMAMRYHGHLFCLALGIPFLSIDYTGERGKVGSLIRRTGYTRWSLDWQALEAGRLAAALDELAAERDTWSRYLRQQAEEMVQGLHRTYAEVFGGPEDGQAP